MVSAREYLCTAALKFSEKADSREQRRVRDPSDVGREGGRERREGGRERREGE
jgi:hypothetical protein